MASLRIIVAVNLVASGAHFAHNAIFFSSYPLPTWITGPWFVLGAWLVIATLLLVGYAQMRVGAYRRAVVPVAAYCTASLLGLGHYLYGPPSGLSLTANGLIVFETAAACALLGRLGWGVVVESKSGGELGP